MCKILCFLLQITSESPFHVYINAVSERSPNYDIATQIESFNGDSFREILPSCVKREPPMVSRGLLM